MFTAFEEQSIRCFERYGDASPAAAAHSRASLAVLLANTIRVALALTTGLAFL